MRAVRIETCGRPPVVGEHPSPVPGADRELVRVVAAPITPLDLLCAGGTSYFGTPALPYVPGVQGVGTAGGRLVWFPTPAGMAPGDGSMAELASVPSEDLVELPAGADPLAVAALGLSAVAAYMALTWRGELAAGEQVLVLGGGGVVGQAAIQLARLAGARRVVAAARSSAGLERARLAGADAVIPLGNASVTEWAGTDARTSPGDPSVTEPAGTDARTSPGDASVTEPTGTDARTSPGDASVTKPAGTDARTSPGDPSVTEPDARTSPGDTEVAAPAGAIPPVSTDVAELADRFSAACDGPVDLVLDPLFGIPAAAAARTLRKGGRLVNLGGSASETCPLDSSTLRSRSLRVLGYTNNELTREQLARAVAFIAEQSAAGRLAVVYEVSPLAEAAAAWQRQAAGTARGRIVLHTS
ncbi:zinc-binding dehydrogenase [Nonomuraea insulae]|uniref:Zinc-binding dehydrogenase n=1 Tax=Nonomuraea insulae TaxID=1616787 RepID=A0ABW1CRN9_9ACTN